jgi:hypothetical protein
MCKGVIDYKQIPKSLLNLRRAVLIFFLTLIGASFSILGVSVVSYNDFNANSDAVDQSIFLVSYLNNLRLSFRTLILVSQTRTSNTDLSKFLEV